MAPNALMERTTVQKSSYKPYEIRCRTPAAVPKICRDGALNAVTVHQVTYRPYDVPCATITPPPRDHDFLAGDSLGRFHCTTSITDYVLKTGERARPIIQKCSKKLSTVPIQSNTTTGSVYRPQAMTKLWRYSGCIQQVIPIPIDALSVHRASYKPWPTSKKTDHFGRMKSCKIRSNAAARCQLSTVPVESGTTYTTDYKRGNNKRCLQAKRAVPAHDYE